MAQPKIYLRCLFSSYFKMIMPDTSLLVVVHEDLLQRGLFQKHIVQMQQVKLVNDRRDIAVIHKGNRGLVRSLRIVRNAGQIKEIARDSLLDMYPKFWTHIYKLGGHHGCFSVFYRRHPFCFCLNPFVIIVINILIYSNCKFFK